MTKKIIVITRPKDRSQVAADIVTQLGGIPQIVPTLELKLVCSETLLNLFKRLNELDWLIFTSPSAVESVFKFCPKLKERLKSDCKIGVIGTKTAKSLEQYALKSDLIPKEYTAEGLLKEFKNYDLKGKVIGIPRTMSARKTLPDGLIEMGAEVIVAKAYESDIPQDKTKIKNLIKEIKNYEIDAITFTSPLTAHNLIKELDGTEKTEVIEKLKSDKIYVASIGPITYKALKEYGIESLSPKTYTVKDMLNNLFNEMNSIN